MFRSFDNRVFGGVCGGLAALLPVNAWVIRMLFVLLAPLTWGGFALVYLMLWWAVPQASLAGPNRGGAWWLIYTFGVVALVTVAVVLRYNGLTQLADGTDLFLPVLALLAGIVFFAKQLGPSA